MKYPLTFFVKTLGPNTAGEARGPIIRIKEEYKEDTGIYYHELLHVKQWATLSLFAIPIAYILIQLGLQEYAGLSFMTVALHAALYRFIPGYRLWAESEAYKEQAKYYQDDRRPLFAEFISAYYNLNITPEEALKILNKS